MSMLALALVYRLELVEKDESWAYSTAEEGSALVQEE